MQHANLGGGLQLLLRVLLLLVQRIVIGPLLPLALAKLDRPVPNVLPIHLLESHGEVRSVREAHEPVTLGLPGPLVPHDPRHVERREPRERLRQDVVVHLVPEVAAEQAVVVLRPFGQGGVLPRLAGGAPREGLALGVGLVVDVAAGDGGLDALEGLGGDRLGVALEELLCVALELVVVRGRRVGVGVGGGGGRGAWGWGWGVGGLLEVEGGGEVGGIGGVGELGGGGGGGWVSHGIGSGIVWNGKLGFGDLGIGGDWVKLGGKRRFEK